MPQDFDFKINGESVPVVSASLVQTMDTAADGFEVDVVISKTNEPELYEQIKAPLYAPVTIFIDGKLGLTGNITKRKRSKTKGSVTTSLGGFSKTFNFIDSHIPGSYQLDDLTLHGMATELAKATATKVIFNTEPGGIIKRAVAKRGQSAFDFLKPLAQKRSQIMSCTPEGALLFHTANVESEPIGSISEDDQNSLIASDFSVEFDDRKRFKTYKVVSVSPFANSEKSQAVSSDDNINQPRHRVISSSDITGSVEEIAAWQRNLSIIDALTIPVPVFGWTAPDGKQWEPNKIISFKSETCFIENAFSMLIRSVEFIYNKKSKSAIISLIPPNVYTKNAVVEPWFQ